MSGFTAYVRYERDAVRYGHEVTEEWRLEASEQERGFDRTWSVKVRARGASTPVHFQETVPANAVPDEVRRELASSLEDLGGGTL
jgi:hypothetical protein